MSKFEEMGGSAEDELYEIEYQKGQPTFEVSIEKMSWWHKLEFLCTLIT